jgi:hypothetical protein
MSLKRVVIACVLAATPLIACSSAPPEDRAQSSDALQGNGFGNWVCATGPQVNLLWDTTNGTINPSDIWYPLGTTSMDSYGRSWTTYAGVSYFFHPAQVEYIAWVQTSQTTNFQLFNGVCNPGPGPGHGSVEPISNAQGGSGGDPIIRCVMPGAPYGFGSLCATVGTMNSFNYDNACSDFLNTYTGKCQMP